MHFYDAALVNREKHLLTKMNTNQRRKRLARKKSGRTKQVKAMLERIGLK